MLKLWVAIVFFLPVTMNGQKRIFSELLQLNAHSPIRDISLPFNSLQLVDYPADSYTRYDQYILNDSSNIYLTIAGSGQLWKIDTSSPGLLKRVDSTVYFGDNFLSAYFHYGNKLYNFGGYGFWQTTGVLRYFDQQNQEWFIQELDRPFPFVTGGLAKNFWIDYKEGNLYLFRPAFKEQGYTNAASAASNIVLKLDLHTFHWEVLGEPAETGQKIFDLQLNPVLGIDEGLLAFSSNELILLDFKKNRVFEVNQEKKNLFFSKALRSKGKTLMASVGDKIYFGYFPEGRLDSMVVYPSDLIEKREEKRIYQSKPFVVSADFMWLAVLLGAIVLVIYLAVIYVRRRNNRKAAFPTITDDPPEIIESGNRRQLISLSAQEKILLQAFLQHHQEGKLVSQADLNRILGVHSKPPELQKKHRSDAIRSLNNNLMAALDSHQQVVLKRRSDGDGRVFDYYISEQIPQNQLEILNTLSKNV